jgi:hypothetical protein
MAGAVDVEEDYDYFSDREGSNLALLDNTGLLPLLETSEHQPEDKTKYIRDYIFHDQLAAASASVGDGEM